MVIVRGIKRSSGEFQGQNYDNMVFHVDCSDDGKMVVGEPVDKIKCKTSIFNSVCQSRHWSAADLVGHELRFFYDRYGNVEDFDILG